MGLELRHNFLRHDTAYKTSGFSRSAKCRSLTTAIRASVLLTALTSFIPVAHSQSLTDITYPGATSTNATGINNSGQIVGNYNIGSNYQGFLYTGGAFSTIDFPGDTPGYTIDYFGGISDSGQIVGWYSNVGGTFTTGFRYQGGAFSSIIFPGSSDTEPLGISSNGTYIVGAFRMSGNLRGFLYTGGVFTTIDYPSATNTVPTGINNNGTIVGWYIDAAGSGHSFLDDGGVFTTFTVPGFNTTAYGINDGGIIVGNAGNAATGSHGFLGTDGAFTTFNAINGMGLVNGINDNGAIVGQYVDAAHNGHGFLYSTGVQGYINPKYMIVGVTYAPPGSQSSVTYTDSALVGNSTTIKSSFTDQTSLSASVTVSGQIPGFAQGKVTGTYTNAYGQQSNSSNQVIINKTTQVSDKTQGPLNSLAGVNHDFDVIWVWLNPVLPFNVLTIDPQAITWNGYGYDANDQSGLDILPVVVGWLNGDIPVPSNVAAALARTWASGYIWAPGQGPGLTGPGPGTDFATIVQADPFWQCNQVPANCPATVDLTRFTLSNNQNIVYEQAPPGGQPITQTYQLQYQDTSIQGQGTSSTQQQSFGLDVSISGSGFWSALSADFKTSQMLTWTTSVDTSITNTTTSTALASVTGPTCTVSSGLNSCNPQYTGPVEYEIYQDNQYGTFMFFPVSGSSTPLSMPTSTSLPNAISGAPYGPVLLTATGGSGTGYTWCVESGSQCVMSGPPLPAGFTLNSYGICGNACTTIALSSTGSPAAPIGAYSFTVKVTDSVGDVATGLVTLNISAGAPAVSLSAAPTFSPQLIQSTSSPQMVTLTNTGNTNLTFSGISATTPFAIATSGTTCSISTLVAALATCTVAVTFTPTAGGTASGILSFTDNAPNSSQTLILSGTGQDFSFAPPTGSSTSASVPPGQTATYTLSVGGEGGLSGTVTFVCTGAPSGANCTIAPNPVTLGNSTTNVTVTVTTTAASISLPHSRPVAPVPPLSPSLRDLFMLAWILAVMAWAIVHRNQLGVKRWNPAMVVLAAGLLLTSALAGCGGGGTGGSGATANPRTPAGNYTLSVTGTIGSGSSAVSHSVALTLNVS